MAKKDEDKRDVRRRAAKSMSKATRDMPAQTLPDRVAKAVTQRERDETRNVRGRAFQNMSKAFKRGESEPPDPTRNVRARAFSNMQKTFNSDRPQPKVANRRPRLEGRETPKPATATRQPRQEKQQVQTKPVVAKKTKPTQSSKKQPAPKQSVRNQMAQNPIDVKGYLAKKQADPAPGRASLFSKAKEVFGGAVNKLQGSFGRQGAPQSANKGYWDPSGIEARSQRPEAKKARAGLRQKPSPSLPVDPAQENLQVGSTSPGILSSGGRPSFSVGNVQGAQQNLGGFKSAAEAEAQFASNRNRLDTLRTQNQNLARENRLQAQARSNQQLAFNQGESDIAPNMRGYVAPGQRAPAGPQQQGGGFQGLMTQADQQLQALGEQYERADDPFERGAIRRRMDLIRQAVMEQSDLTQTGMRETGALQRTGLVQEGAMNRAQLGAGSAMARQQQEQQFRKANPQLYSQGGNQFADMFSESNKLWNNALERAISMSGEFNPDPEAVLSLANRIYRTQTRRFYPSPDEFIIP